MFFFTGWNDGTFNEFQNKWDEQQVKPGGIIPGGGNNYDKETDGISCYTCDSCNKEPFDAEVYGVGTKSGCYMCVKAWDDGKWLYLHEGLMMMVSGCIYVKAWDDGK